MSTTTCRSISQHNHGDITTVSSPSNHRTCNVFDKSISVDSHLPRTIRSLFTATHPPPVRPRGPPLARRPSRSSPRPPASPRPHSPAAPPAPPPPPPNRCAQGLFRRHPPRPPPSRPLARCPRIVYTLPDVFATPPPHARPHPTRSPNPCPPPATGTCPGPVNGGSRPSPFPHHRRALPCLAPPARRAPPRARRPAPQPPARPLTAPAVVAPPPKKPAQAISRRPAPSGGGPARDSSPFTPTRIPPPDTTPAPPQRPGPISPTRAPHHPSPTAPQTHQRSAPNHLKSFLEKTPIARETPDSPPCPAAKLLPGTGRPHALPPRNASLG